MHMCMLGIEKALIPLAKRVFNRKGKLQNFMYKTLVLALRTNQKKVSKISVDWLMAMPFSGKEVDQIGTSTWNSEHYAIDTRFHLVTNGDVFVTPEIICIIVDY